MRGWEKGIGYDMMTGHVRCDLILLRRMGVGEKYAVLVRFHEKLFVSSLRSRRCLEASMPLVVGLALLSALLPLSLQPKPTSSAHKY